MYVILNRNEYLDKINKMLSTTEKFVQIKMGLTNILKSKTNKLIYTLNAAQNSIKIPKIYKTTNLDILKHINLIIQ